MYKLTLYLIFILLLYSCSPINKQHGYMLDDLISASSKIEQMDIKKYHKNDILELLGSPSIKIKDIDDVWIYLISLKEEKIFENDEINYQQVFRFSFDSKGFIIQSDILDKNNYNGECVIVLKLIFAYWFFSTFSNSKVSLSIP